MCTVEILRLDEGAKGAICLPIQFRPFDECTVSDIEQEVRECFNLAGDCIVNVFIEEKDKDQTKQKGGTPPKIRKMGGTTFYDP